MDKCKACGGQLVAADSVEVYSDELEAIHMCDACGALDSESAVYK